MAERKEASINTRIPLKSSNKHDRLTASEWLHKVWKLADALNVKSAAMGVRVNMKRSSQGASA